MPCLPCSRDFSGASGSSSGVSSGPATSSVHVRVLNGSGVNGAAARTLAALERDGFVGAGTGNNPQGVVSTSEIRYPSGGATAAGVVAGYVPGARLVVDDSVTAGSVVLVLSRGFSGLSPPTTAAPATSSPASPAPATPQPGSLAPVPGAC